MTTIDLQAALDRALSLRNEKCLDAATIAAAEQLMGKSSLGLGAAVSALGNDQLAQVAGFLNQSLSYEQLQRACDSKTYDMEQAREWEVTEQQYCIAHEIALLSHMVERRREGTQ